MRHQSCVDLSSPTRIPILFLGKKGGPSPSPAMRPYKGRESRRPGHDLNRYASIRGAGPGQQPLLVAERAKAPLVTEKKSRSWHWKLHCKDCVNRHRQPMWGGRSLRSHLSLPLGPVSVGCVLLGSCPHLFVSSWSLHLVLPFSDFGHSTTETASNRQVAVGVSLQVTRTQKLKDQDWRIPAPATTD